MNLFLFLLKRFLIRYWFCLIIIFTTIIAEVSPFVGTEEGLHPEMATPYLVGIIYYIYGWSIDPKHLWKQIYHYKAHLYIQFFGLLVNPMVLSIVCYILQILDVDFWTLKGMFVLACMPPPTAIPVVLTYAAYGNHALAIINTIMATVLSCITCPTLLFLMLGSTPLVPLSKLKDLVYQVILPLMFGQLTRRSTFNLTKKINNRYLTNFCLVIIVILTFNILCQVFVNPESDLNASHVMTSVILAIVSQIFMTIAIINIAFYLEANFSQRDIMAIIFCSTMKSFDLGTNILKILYQGFSHLYMISLPLTAYQPIQLIFGGILVNYFRDQVKRSYRKRRNAM